ncbi:MAG: phospholipase D-like domain-containing protein [Christensenellales bacterium]|jgi:hypothetical protein
MELEFIGGRFVSSFGELNFKEVLDDFVNAKIIRILTYNISKNMSQDELLNRLKGVNADVQLITNVPSRMAEYYNSDAGLRMRSMARNNIRTYIQKLDPDSFPGRFSPFFNVNNHAKIIGTENIVYIGSANYSNESANSVETGVLIKDKSFIQRLYTEFFEVVRDESLSYFDESFSAFRVFVLSLLAKFEHHYRIITSSLYKVYEGKFIFSEVSSFINEWYLSNFYFDLEELESVCGAADDTYDEDDDNYNEALEKLVSSFSTIKIEWLKEVISEGGALYDLLAYDVTNEANKILQNEYYAEAYDEHLESYVELSLDEAAERYDALHDAFSWVADSFIEEIQRILSALDAAICFTSKWKAKWINPEVDNT